MVTKIVQKNAQECFRFVTLSKMLQFTKFVKMLKVKQKWKKAKIHKLT